LVWTATARKGREIRGKRVSWVSFEWNWGLSWEKGEGRHWRSRKKLAIFNFGKGNQVMGVL